MLHALRTAALFAALPLCVTSDETTTLKWHFTKGEVLRYRVLVEQETEMSIMPDAGMKIDMGMVLAETVRDVAADGTALLDMKYEALRMDSDSPMMELHYDSTRTEASASNGASEFAKVFDAILKAKVQMKMDPSGHVTDISGIQEMLEQAASAMPGGQGPGSGEMIKQMFSEPAMRKMVEVNVFPGTALAVGATWQRSLEVPNAMVGTMKFSMDNKFLGVEEHAGQPCAKIEVGTKVALEKGPEAGGAMKFKVSMGESGGNATQWFGMKTGRLVEITMTTQMALQLSMPSPDEDPEHGMKMDSTTDITLHMLLLGKDEPAFEAEKKKDAPKK